MKNSALPCRIFWPALLAIVMLAGCRDPKPVAYRTPKEKDSTVMAVPTDSASKAAAPAGNMPAGHPDIGGATMAAGPLPAATGGGAMPGGAMAGGPAMATAAGPGLAWKAPAHWTAKPASSMRKGSYTVTGADGATADLGITAFPGDVGGEVANVNRWRGQLQLTPLPAAEAAAAVTHVQQNGLDIGIVEIVNTATPAQRLHGAMVPYQGATWFFKLLGPDSVVGPERAAFLEFLKTIQPAVSDTTPAHAP